MAACCKSGGRTPRLGQLRVRCGRRGAGRSRRACVGMGGCGRGRVGAGPCPPPPSCVALLAVFFCPALACPPARARRRPRWRAAGRCGPQHPARAPASAQPHCRCRGAFTPTPARCCDGMRGDDRPRSRVLPSAHADGQDGGSPRSPMSPWRRPRPPRARAGAPAPGTPLCASQPTPPRLTVPPAPGVGGHVLPPPLMGPSAIVFPLPHPPRLFFCCSPAPPRA